MFINNDGDSLDELIETGDFAVDENTGLPVKSADGKVRNYSANEVIAIILPYVYEDISISNRELSRRTGINTRTIGKYRRSKEFRNKLAELTNDKLLDLRCLALEELEKMLKDKTVNNNTKVKVIHEILAHSVSVAELALNAGKETPKIDINVLLKEVEDMGIE